MHSGCLTSAEKTPSVWKRFALPLYRTTTMIYSSNRGLHRTAKTKEQSQRSAPTCSRKMVSHDRPVYQERHAAQLIMARRPTLRKQSEYICADLDRKSVV